MYPVRTNLMDTEWLLKPPLKGVVVIDQPADATTIAEAVLVRLCGARLLTSRLARITAGRDRLLAPPKTAKGTTTAVAACLTVATRCFYCFA